MKNTQNGFTGIIVAVIIALILGIGGTYWYMQQNGENVMVNSETVSGTQNDSSAPSTLTPGQTSPSVNQIATPTKVSTTPSAQTKVVSVNSFSVTVPDNFTYTTNFSRTHKDAKGLTVYFNGKEVLSLVRYDNQQAYDSANPEKNSAYTLKMLSEYNGIYYSNDTGAEMIIVPSVRVVGFFEPATKIGISQEALDKIKGSVKF